jgi:hypothetical protein
LKRMSTSQVAFSTNSVGKFEKMRQTDRQNPEVTKPTLTVAHLLPHTHAQTDRQNPEVTKLTLTVAHLLPHTHAQTNHGAPAVHRDHTGTVHVIRSGCRPREWPFTQIA